MEVQKYYAETECLLVDLKYLKTFRTLGISVSHCEKLNNYKAKRARCETIIAMLNIAILCTSGPPDLTLYTQNLLGKDHEIALHDTGEKHGIRIKHKQWA